jgi:kinesin family protein 11
MTPNKQNIRVLCRVRPLNELEKANSAALTSLEYQNDNSVTVNIDFATQQSFSFDKVFTPTTPQLDVFEDSTKPLIDDILAGYNATVFAYGQTGAGKVSCILNSI